MAARFPTIPPSFNMLKSFRLATPVARVQPIFTSRWLNTSAISAEKDAFLEKLDGPSAGIAVLNLNRPKAKNAVSVKLLQDFREALKEARFSRYEKAQLSCFMFFYFLVPS